MAENSAERAIKIRKSSGAKAWAHTISEADLQEKKHLIKHFKRFDEVLRHRCNDLSDNGNANLQKIEYLTAEYKGITTTITALQGDVDALKAAHATVQADVQSVKTDLAPIKADTVIYLR